MSYPWLWTLASFQCIAPQTSGPAAAPPPETPLHNNKVGGVSVEPIKEQQVMGRSRAGAHLVWAGLQVRYSPWSKNETASPGSSQTSSTHRKLEHEINVFFINYITNHKEPGVRSTDSQCPSVK